MAKPAKATKKRVNGSVTELEARRQEARRRLAKRRKAQVDATASAAEENTASTTDNVADDGVAVSDTAES